jgi:hypothetical protein
MDIVKVLELLIPMLLGSGGSLLFIKLRQRSEAAKVGSEESSYFDTVVRNSSKATTELLHEMQEMAKQQAELIKEVNQFKEDYHRLRVLVKNLLNEYQGVETDAVTAIRKEIK